MNTKSKESKAEKLKQKQFFSYKSIRTCYVCVSFYTKIGLDRLWVVFNRLIYWKKLFVYLYKSLNMKSIIDICFFLGLKDFFKVIWFILCT